MSNSCVATYVSSLFWCMSWTALHFLSSLGVCLLWHLHTFSKWFTFPHHDYLLHMLSTFLPHLNFCNIFDLWEFLSFLILLCQMYCSFVHAFSWHLTVCCLLWLPLVLWCSLHFHPPGPGQCLLTVITSSFMPLINCSFRILSFSLYSHPFTLIFEAVYPFFSIFTLLSY